MHGVICLACAHIPLLMLWDFIVSLTGAIIIARYVHQELTVDHYILHLDRTFMLTNVQDEGTSLNERGKNVSSVEMLHLSNIMACFSPK